MPAGLNFGFGMQRLVDANQRYLRGSFPFYLRTKNFPDTQNQMWSQLGFAIAPTGAPDGASANPVTFAFNASGNGTEHYITIGSNTYIYIEQGRLTPNSVAIGIAESATTALGVNINLDPNVTISVPTGTNEVVLTPANLSGDVVPVSASDGNASALMWITTNPAVTAAIAPGTTDTLIDPPPFTSEVSIHNIGMSEGKLRFGARVIRISQTFVQAQMLAMGLTSQDQVWQQPSVVGIRSENYLYSIEDFKHYELAGKTIYWDLTCNRNLMR